MDIVSHRSGGPVYSVPYWIGMNEQASIPYPDIYHDGYTESIGQKITRKIILNGPSKIREPILREYLPLSSPLIHCTRSIT